MRSVQSGKAEEISIGFSKINYILLSTGLLLTIVGFWFLSRPPVDGFLTMTLAPLILVVNYLVLIPLAILYRSPKK
ncbi:MAG: DUF3098 domain-containing protein [Candidatus Delongbacteria bacterium]|nr:DUF3098 domain-containing protein [Candidatus Delongbacteria bacterium]